MAGGRSRSEAGKTAYQVVALLIKRDVIQMRATVIERKSASKALETAAPERYGDCVLKSSFRFEIRHRRRPKKIPRDPIGVIRQLILVAARPLRSIGGS
jgi:hypothetical protein